MQPSKANATAARQNGITHIQAAFQIAQDHGRAALMPYFTLGYPDRLTSLAILEAVAASGADLIELGVPFSDPLADGPTIQHSTQVALERGMTVAGCLELAAELRQRGVHQPLLLMGYVNPILAFGVERYAAQAAQAGVDGLIIPDLPLEEAENPALTPGEAGAPMLGGVEGACRTFGLALVYLLSPASPPQRVQQVAQHTSGFLYLVSLTGVTGARRELPTGLEDFVARTRAVAHTPLAVGFGISSPQQAGMVGRLADGVIVGSALVDTVRDANDPVQAAARFVAGLRQGLEAGR
jgi:tryptophan synthase alpha chain